jgi:protein-tyrosine phosphatase
VSSLTDELWRRTWANATGSNLADVGGRTADGRVRLFRDFDPVDPGGDVPDPYYGGDDGFEEVLTMVERTSATIVERLRAAVAPT